MRVPREFQTEEMKEMENPYVRVTKAMYGLPSVGFDFARYTESKLVGELGYSKVAGFPSMYVRKVQGKVIILGVYVDDLYMTGDLKICRHEMDKIGTLLCSQKKTAEVFSVLVSNDIDFARANFWGVGDVEYSFSLPVDPCILIGFGRIFF